MLIAEFAHTTGLPRDTIRFYVKKRLLHPATRANGYQDFDDEQVERALLIREHQTLGFTLREIAALSDEFLRGISHERQAQVMHQRLAAIEAQAARLRRLRRYCIAKITWLEGGAVSRRPSFALFLRNSADWAAGGGKRESAGQKKGSAAHRGRPVRPSSAKGG